MRVILCESFIVFDLPTGSRHHSDVNPGSTGVDFEIAGNPWLWLEVKNWNAPVIPERMRPIVMADFLDKTKVTSSFWTEIIGKFEGTRSCLEALNQLPKHAEMGLLLEAPRGTMPTFAPMMSALEARLAASRHFKGRIIKVFRAKGLPSVHSGAGASPCQVSFSTNFVCQKPVSRCSVSRQTHVGT